MKKTFSIAWKVSASVFFIALLAGFVLAVKSYGAESFFVLIPALFGIFIILFVSFVKLWFYPGWYKCALIVTPDLLKKTRNNIFIAVPAYFILTLSFLKSLDLILKIGYRDIELVEVGPEFAVAVTIYVLVFIIMLQRSCHVTGLLLKTPSGETGARVKESVCLIPYLLIVFIVFQQSWIIAARALRNPEWLSLLSITFHGFAAAWFVLMFKIRSFYYTAQEYASMEKNMKTDNKIITKLGSGLGAYPVTFYKTWLLSGFWYWAVPIFIYLVVAIVVLSMFLPLTKIIEKLG